MPFNHKILQIVSKSSLSSKRNLDILVYLSSRLPSIKKSISDVLDTSETRAKIKFFPFEKFNHDIFSREEMEERNFPHGNLKLWFDDFDAYVRSIDISCQSHCLLTSTPLFLELCSKCTIRRDDLKCHAGLDLCGEQRANYETLKTV